MTNRNPRAPQGRRGVPTRQQRAAFGAHARAAPNWLFRWRRQAARGVLSAARAGGEGVPASEYRALENQVRELRHMLGKKAMQKENLREAISRMAGPKKTPLRLLSSPEVDL